jgi:hypothetical protein
MSRPEFAWMAGKIFILATTTGSAKCMIRANLEFGWWA